MTGDNHLRGGCQCGEVRYELGAAPLEVYVCHCVECRRQSASAFGISVIARKDAFRLAKGVAKRWSRPTDSGGTLDCFFCPNCGSRLWHEDESDGDIVSVKGGSLDRPPDLASVDHIWVSRKLPGVVIPDSLRQFPEEPDGS